MNKFLASNTYFKSLPYEQIKTTQFLRLNYFNSQFHRNISFIRNFELQKNSFCGIFITNIIYMSVTTVFNQSVRDLADPLRI